MQCIWKGKRTGAPEQERRKALALSSKNFSLANLNTLTLVPLIRQWSQDLLEEREMHEFELKGLHRIHTGIWDDFNLSLIVIQAL
jgi:hypothetical protein